MGLSGVIKCVKQSIDDIFKPIWECYFGRLTERVILLIKNNKRNKRDLRSIIEFKELNERGKIKKLTIKTSEPAEFCSENRLWILEISKEFSSEKIVTNFRKWEKFHEFLF